MAEYILALDASTTSIGWVFARDEEYIRSGIFRPKAKDKWHLRIIQFRNWLNNFIIDNDLHVPSSSIIVYEKATGHHGRRQGNVDTHRKLGAVEFKILEVAHRWGIECVEIYPMQIKATGICKDNLDYAELYIQRYIPYFTFDRSTKAAVGRAGDLADAFGCWLAYLRKLELESLTNRE